MKNVFLFLLTFCLFNSSIEAQDWVEVQVKYKVHMQDVGWSNWKSDGEIAGTTGEGRRIEAIRIIASDADIQYKVHMQDIGWGKWKSNGEIAGTTGESRRIEAIRVELVSPGSRTIKYKVHMQDIGWSDWCSDGEICGTTGQSRRVEAIRVIIEE
jgi:uncharacterized protein YjdB